MVQSHGYVSAPSSVMFLHPGATTALLPSVRSCLLLLPVHRVTAARQNMLAMQPRQMGMATAQDEADLRDPTSHAARVRALELQLQARPLVCLRMKRCF
jgi:hypothetical protein